MNSSKTGYLTVVFGVEEPHPVKVILSRDTLTLQRELPPTHQPSSAALNSNSNNRSTTMIPPEPSDCKEREVKICKNEHGLGVSIKGGAEHGIPVLISKVFKDQPADLCGGLYMGDAIIRVNGHHVEHCTHEDVVEKLRSAGKVTVLTVRYYKSAMPYLLGKTPGQLNSSAESGIGEGEDSNDSNTVSERDEASPRPGDEGAPRGWRDVRSVPLTFAQVTRYVPGTDIVRTNSFEVLAHDLGSSSGVLQCKDHTELSQWTKDVNNNITNLNQHAIKVANTILPANDQVIHCGWVGERLKSTTTDKLNWYFRFLAVRGPHLYILRTPSVLEGNWNDAEIKYRLFEIVFKNFKVGEVDDGRWPCFAVYTGGGVSKHYLNVENDNELTLWDFAIQKATYSAVERIGRKSYGCTWNCKVAGLTLDINTGFTLYCAKDKSVLWSYRFSQLKTSQDDGRSKVTLIFKRADSDTVETQECEFPNLKTVLYAVHAFLGAKLALVDPDFLKIPKFQKRPARTRNRSAERAPTSPHTPIIAKSQSFGNRSDSLPSR